MGSKQEISAASATLPEMRQRKAVNPRSIALGLLGVTFICGLTAYNDYVVANTFMIGNFLPVGLLLFFLSFVLVINGPLHKFLPRVAFSTSEVGVALCMMLVSCSLPSSGLMRYLPSQLIAPWYHAGTSSDYAGVMKDANLPDWLFPTFERQGAARSNEPVVKYFWDRVPLEQDTIAAHISAVPWHAWLRPAIAWGLLVAMVVGAVLCVSIIFRRQWAENERLPYPLANVYLSLIEEPAPGRMLNKLFSSRLFWISAVSVFIIHGFNAMYRYDPRIWPQIPIGYAFWQIFGDPPFSYTDWGFKSATLFFCMVGITYFLQSNVALSLWLCFILFQITKMLFGTYQADFSAGMQDDQNFGSVLMFAATIIFVGRQHLLLVLRQMFSKPTADEPRGRYLPYFAAGWGLVLCFLGIVGWAMLAGMTLGSAVIAVTLSGILYLVIARVVAETGLMFVQTNVPLFKPWYFLTQGLPESMAVKTSVTSFFLTGWLGQIFVHDQRESLSGFVSQSLRVADGAAFENERSSKGVLSFTACLLLALGFGFVVSGASMLYVEYNFGATADLRQTSPINGYSMQSAVKSSVLDASKNYQARGGPMENHNRWEHLSIGVIITGALGILRLRFASWPIHPVGYLLAFTYPMMTIWFSIFVGWLAKVVIVRFGGSTMYRDVKPLFVGLIIGEVGAAAFWLVVSLVLNAMGMQYRAITLLPT